jgi:AcrR family transcriptional regulator
VSPRSYKSARRDAEADRTRAKILRAASRLLRTKQGASAFSLDAVAKRAGVTRLTVYKRFGSRRTLLEAVFDDRAAEGGIDRVAFAMGIHEPEAALARLIEVFCTFWASDPETMRRLDAAGANDPELGALLCERYERRRLALSVIVRRMVEAGRVGRAKAQELIDVLFAVTGFHVFLELKDAKYATADIVRLMQGFAQDAVCRAGEA